MPRTTDDTQLDVLKSDSLSEIASVVAEPCVSILMPTHRKGRETQQAAIRLKNLLNQTSEQLKQSGHDQRILEPIAAKPEDSEFWQHQGEGLAIFLTPENCRMFRLNRHVDERVVVGGSFFVQPLIREQNATGKYFVLLLSWDEATLFRAASESLEVVETDALPAKFNDLVLPRDPEESLQNTSHRSVGNSAGTSTAMFHGHGEGEDKIEADRKQYLSLVGDEVASVVYNTGMPLVVVATNEVSGHFEATKKVAIDAQVTASPKQMSANEIRERAYEAVAPRLKADHDQFAERFGGALANSRATSDLDSVLSAAKAGRVETLMVCHDDQHFNQTNEAVLETLRNGGDVLQCNRDSVLGIDSPLAAIFRY